MVTIMKSLYQGVLIMFRTVFVFLIFSISSSAFASTETEKKELIRISQELNFLKSEVMSISKHRRVDDLEPFSYEDLVRDLDVMSKAIERHVKEPSRQPKSVKPLQVENGYGDFY
ncbi:hypothetical protein FQP81_18210 [Pseudoalteromonas distincta]|nr:hypothetical protein FQP81_18210 [Pseudoalteromonas elyakovii]